MSHVTRQRYNLLQLAVAFFFFFDEPFNYSDPFKRRQLSLLMLLEFCAANGKLDYSIIISPSDSLSHSVKKEIQV